MSYLYLMKVSGTSGVYKIGATVNIEKRMARMEKQKDWKLECIRYVEIDGDFNKCLTIEQNLHRKYSNYRLASEWFALPDEILGDLLI